MRARGTSHVRRTQGSSLRRDNGTLSVTGRAEGRSPSAFLFLPPFLKGDQGGLAWGCKGGGRSPPFGCWGTILP